jgi:hypothetical protein
MKLGSDGLRCADKTPNTGPVIALPAAAEADFE